jgi:hypothetical protein
MTISNCVRISGQIWKHTSVRQPEWTAFWHFDRQHYRIYKEGRFVRQVDRFKDVKPYLT